MTKINNLYEIIAFILKELDRKGNPDDAVGKFDLSSKTYKEIIEVATMDKYIECDEIYMDGSPNLDNAYITAKGYKLMKEY